MVYVISGYFIVTIVLCIVNKVNGYESFLKGVKDGSKIVLNMFSCMLSFILAIKCLEGCGIIDDLCNISTLGWLPEIIVQMLVRPLSSGSSMSIMLSIFEKYGVDSIPAIFSTFIHSACDTVFYIVVFYFSSIGVVKYKKALTYGIMTVVISYALIILSVIIFF